MATTLLSQMGGIVCVDGRENELIFSAIADGVCKPGHGVAILGAAGATLGDIIKHDVSGGDDRFVGILLPKYNTDCDSVNVNGEICEIVVPASGHKYNIKVVDMGAAAEGNVGTPVRFHATTDGEWLVGTTAIEVSNYCATVNKLTVDNDLFVEVIWRA